MFNDMDQTQSPMLLYFLLYGCTCKKKKKKAYVKKAYYALLAQEGQYNWIPKECQWFVFLLWQQILNAMLDELVAGLVANNFLPWAAGV